MTHDWDHNDSIGLLFFQYQDILTGDAEVVLTGGTENMSMAPYTVRGTRFGTKLGVDLKVGGHLCLVPNPHTNN